MEYFKVHKLSLKDNKLIVKNKYGFKRRYRVDIILNIDEDSSFAVCNKYLMNIMPTFPNSYMLLKYSEFAKDLLRWYKNYKSGNINELPIKQNKNMFVALIENNCESGCLIDENEIKEMVRAYKVQEALLKGVN